MTSPETASSLLDQSATSLLANLRTGKISALEVMTETLDRIDARNPAVNALVGMADREDLLAQARQHG